VVSEPSFHRVYIYISTCSASLPLCITMHNAGDVNLLIISFFRTDFLIFFYCYDYVRTSGHSLKRTYYIIIYPPAAATVPIYNIHSRESCATFGIQTTVNSDYINIYMYIHKYTRFGDKNRRHSGTWVYLLYVS
jgi:hypothetical protein